MAKKSAVVKNERRKKLAKANAGKRAELKAIANDKNASFDERLKAMIKLSEMPRNSSKTRVRNRCEITGRPRGYYRKFSMSRIALRTLGAFGRIVGLKKSSW